jgi:hypothetical protein
LMVTITREVTAEMVGRCSADEVTTGRVLAGLRRWVAREAVSDALYEDLEAVLGEHASPALDPEEVAAIAARLRRATTGLVAIVPDLVKPYPIDEVRRVIDMRAQQPPPEEARGHLVRQAVAILALLDLMGDAAA